MSGSRIETSVIIICSSMYVYINGILSRLKYINSCFDFMHIFVPIFVLIYIFFFVYAHGTHRVYCDFRVCHFETLLGIYKIAIQKRVLKLKFSETTSLSCRTRYDNLRYSVAYYTKLTYNVVSRKIISVV